MAGRRTGRALVAELAGGGDVEEVLKRFRVARQTLKSRGSRGAIQTRKLLARVQADLLAARFAPHAMSRLIKLMGEEKPEIGLKAALAVLQAGVRRGAAKAKGQGAAEDAAAALDGPETERLMRAMLAVLRGGAAAAEDEEEAGR